MTDLTLPILKRTLEIISERGWTMGFSSYSLVNGGPVNIRTAVGIAVRELANGSHDELIAALSVLTGQLSGIMHWEAGTQKRSRSHEEVVAKLTSIIDRMEKNEIRADSHSLGRSGTDSRTV